MTDLNLVAWVTGGCLVAVYVIKAMLDARRHRVDTGARVTAFRDGFERGAALRRYWTVGPGARPLTDPDGITETDIKRAMRTAFAIDVQHRDNFGWVMSSDVHARWKLYALQQQGETGVPLFVWPAAEPASHLIGLPVRVVDGSGIQALEWRNR